MVFIQIDTPSPLHHMSTKAPTGTPADDAEVLSPTDAVHAEIADVVKPELPEELREAALAIGDGKALAENLRTGDEDAFIELARSLKMRTLEWSCNATEGMINTVFKLRGHTGLPYAELINALADIYIQQDGGWRSAFANWSHSLCHLFEKYGRNTDPKYPSHSFLEVPSDLPAAEKLFLENARRAIDEGELSNTSRTTGAMVRFNIDQLTPETLDGAFPFRPLPEERERFLKLHRSEYETQQRLFFSAETPREFLVSMVRALEKFSYTPEENIPPLLLIADSLTPEELTAYLQKFASVNGQVPTIDELRDSIAVAEAATEALPGTFVDVDDTLVIKGELNERVVEAITKRADKGESVTVVSGGDPSTQTGLLRSLGLDERFLPVQSKDVIRGKVVEKLIDDTPPAFQGVRATSYSTPNNAW